MKQLPLVLLLLAAPALAPAAVGAADSDLPVAVGQRVRVREAGGQRVTGEVVEVLPDALVVRVTKRAQARRLDLSRLDRLEISRGEHGNAHVGAIAGFVPGFAFGALIGAAAGCFEDDSGDCDSLAPALIGGIFVGTVTGVIGALIGWAVRTEHWEQVHLPGIGKARWEPALIPVRGGVGAGLTLRF